MRASPPPSSHVRMGRLQRPTALYAMALLLTISLLLIIPTCSASAVWPGDDAYGLESLMPPSALLDTDDIYTPPDAFTPLDLSLDEPTAPHASSPHSFTPLSLSLDPPSSADALSHSYHDFLALSTTGGSDESFYMAGTYHSLPAASPATFNDVSMSIRETPVHGAGSPGSVPYDGVLSMTVRCVNGSLTLLYSDGVVLEDGDAATNNGTFTFTNVTFTSTLVAANDALSAFTFIPAASSLTGNVSCPYLVLTNQSLYTGQFIFDLTSAPLSSPAATVARVSFNLTIVPNATQLYALYTGLAGDIANVLGVSAARVEVVEAVVDVAAADTAVVLDFLPVGWHLMQANQNDSVAALVAAFIALTPTQLSQTTWMRYVQPDSITQLCADGSYRTSCAVVVAAGAAAAATAISSSLAFIVGLSVGGAVLVAVTATIGWRYASKRQSMRPPLSPLRKASLRDEMLAGVHPSWSAAIESSPESLAIVQDAISVAIDDQLMAMQADTDRSRRSSRTSLGSRPSSRRATKRRNLVQFAPPEPGGAERLEMDLQGRLRAGGIGEGRRYMYQPQLVVNDTRMDEVRERRHTLVQQLEERQRESYEMDRGSPLAEAFLSPVSFSTRSSLLSLSPMRSASLAAAALHIPAIQVAGGRKHLHYGDDDDSDDEDGDDQYTDGPRFIDASSATVSTSPQPHSLASFASPSSMQHDAFTAVVPSFPHPSTFLPARVESKRASASAARQSVSGGLLARLGGEETAFDGLHVGYSDGGSGANTPSLSTQDIANEWLVDDDASTLDRLEQGGSPEPVRRMLSDSPLQTWGKSPLGGLSLQQSHEAKRGSWARDNAKRQSHSNKRNSGRITLDLSKAVFNPVPAMAQNSNDKASLSVGPSKSIWSKLGLSSSNGGRSGGMVKEAKLDRPLMRPLTANAPPHHPRLSIYQQSEVF